MRIAIAVLIALASGGCERAHQAPMSGQSISVHAAAETEPVGTVQEDAADDPAIWRNTANPAASLIVATDKKAGLHVYDLGGKSLAFDSAGRLNNVDLIDMGERGIIVAASDRNDEANARLRFYRLDPDGPKLLPLGSLPAGKGEAYGVCLARAADGSILAFSVLKSGIIHQIMVSHEDGGVSGKIVRTLKVPGQSEGCVVDPRTDQLFVGEEDSGVWQFDASPDAPATGKLVARVDGRQLVADVEGITLAADGTDGGLLVVSSQGDNSFALYRLPGMQPTGRFRIVRGRFGSVEETDGIALALGDFGPDYPGGLFVAQDGQNEPHAQNFKLVPWDAVAKR